MFAAQTMNVPSAQRFSNEKARWLQGRTMLAAMFPTTRGSAGNRPRAPIGGVPSVISVAPGFTWRGRKPRSICRVVGDHAGADARTCRDTRALRLRQQPRSITSTAPRPDCRRAARNRVAARKNRLVHLDDASRNRSSPSAQASAQHHLYMTPILQFAHTVNSPSQPPKPPANHHTSPHISPSHQHHL